MKTMTGFLLGVLLVISFSQGLYLLVVASVVLVLTLWGKEMFEEY